jgi:hypothetical protein
VGDAAVAIELQSTLGGQFRHVYRAMSCITPFTIALTMALLRDQVDRVVLTCPQPAINCRPAIFARARSATNHPNAKQGFPCNPFEKKGPMKLYYARAGRAG